MASAQEDKTSLLDSLDAVMLPGNHELTTIAEPAESKPTKNQKSKSLDTSAARSSDGDSVSKPIKKRKKATPATELSEKKGLHAVAEDSDITATPLPSASKGREIQKSGKKYRQAQETQDTVEVLCFSCRRSKDTTVQKSMTAFFRMKLPDTSEDASGDQVIVVDDSDDDTTNLCVVPDTPLCTKCRRPMQSNDRPVKLAADSLKGTGELPPLQRLRGYRNIAKNQGIPFTISEHAASALMRSDCVACGDPAPLRGHGLTRLRKWPEGLQRPERGGFMGPYAEGNLATACTMCNMLKGYRTVRGLVESCRHIASKHTPGENFGEYPHRFHDNVSKRSRSSYISQSSTHTKTHALTREEFNSIVGHRCYYCHKEPRKPKTLGVDDRGHFNGLDRLDSTNRVYTSDTTVACCGTCNMMKYKWELEDFLSQCRKVARFNVNEAFSEEDNSEIDDSELLQPEPGQVDVEGDAEMTCDAVDLAGDGVESS